MAFIEFLKTHWHPIALILAICVALLFIYTHSAQLFRKE